MAENQRPWGGVPAVTIAIVKLSLPSAVNATNLKQFDGIPSSRRLLEYRRIRDEMFQVEPQIGVRPRLCAVTVGLS
jgi:hypothetical protein